MASTATGSMAGDMVALVALAAHAVATARTPILAVVTVSIKSKVAHTAVVVVVLGLRGGLVQAPLVVSALFGVMVELSRILTQLKTPQLQTKVRWEYDNSCRAHAQSKR